MRANPVHDLWNVDGCGMRGEAALNSILCLRVIPPDRYSPLLPLLESPPLPVLFKHLKSSGENIHAGPTLMVLSGGRRALC